MTEGRRTFRRPPALGFLSGRSPFAYLLILTWKPASFRALTTAAASKSPVTSKSAVRGLTVSPLTPSTLATDFLIAEEHAGQQLWALLSLRIETLPAGTSAAGLSVNVLLDVSPK